MPGSSKRARPAPPGPSSRSSEAAGAPKASAPLKTAGETQAILARLYGQHPNATTELDFTTPFELLVATILSAQSSDVRVNQVTPAFFARYPDAKTLAAATTAELEPQIVATGFFRQKAKMLLGMAEALLAKHGGEVPADMDALTSLPGVGRKTANVVLGHALGVPGMPVDRHVLRVANRIGIAQAATPEEIESQLCAALPREQWTLASSTLILHGRRICRPTQPLCPNCAVVDTCVFAAEMRTAAAAVAISPRQKSAGRGARQGATAAPAPSARPPHTEPPRRKAGANTHTVRKAAANTITVRKPARGR
jgi:endonuclease-3